MAWKWTASTTGFLLKIGISRRKKKKEKSKAQLTIKGMKIYEYMYGYTEAYLSNLLITHEMF